MSAIGTKSLSKSFIGTKEVTAIYIGNTKVYSNQQPPVSTATTLGINNTTGASVSCTIPIRWVSGSIEVLLDGTVVTTISSSSGNSPSISVPTGSHTVAIDGGVFTFLSYILGSANQGLLTSISFGNNYGTAFGNNVFTNTTNLQQAFVIPEGVTDIGEHCFNNSGVTSITIPSSFRYFSGQPETKRDVFASCQLLTQFISNNSTYTTLNNGRLLVTGDTIIAAAMGGRTSYSIPSNSSITTIGECAFEGLINLQSVTIPSNITTISRYAFAQSGLTSISIPSGVIRIYDHVFYACANTVSISVAAANQYYDSRDNCNAIIAKVNIYKTDGETILYSKDTLVVGCKNTVIPSTVKSIGENSFMGCYGLSSITIPNGIERISKQAFSECSTLNNVVVPSSVTGVYDWAFEKCDSLTNITFNHTASDSLTFASAGTLSGVFYTKTARSMTVNYYGNSTVANYSYSSDNITATLNLLS